MIEVTRKEAKRLFSLGRKVVILPSRISPSHETFHKLTLQRDFFHRDYPDDRIDEYSSIYCNDTNGHELKYYLDPIKVLLARTGNGFEVRDYNTRERLFIVRGGDASIVQFVNSRFLSVVNAGYLPERYTKKIKYI